MSARPVLVGVKTLASASFTVPPVQHSQMLRRVIRTSASPSLVHHLAAASIAPPRLCKFHNAAFVAAEAVHRAPAEGQVPTTPPQEPFDTRHAAFMGEADSNDGFEANYVVNPPTLESLDASASAFLGESDSDDHFEGERVVRPPKEEALDASAAAFLGEADSNDAFEGEDAVNPRHPEPIDPSTSAFHGERGEHDHDPDY